MKYLIERQDGGVSVMDLVDGADLNEAVRKWAELDAPPVSVKPIVDEPDHEFFDGWKHIGGGRVGFDMLKCREIHRKRMRLERAPKLAALDVEYQRADEVGDTQKKRHIAKEKQRLRDVTADPRIDAATTPEELKAIWPL